MASSGWQGEQFIVKRSSNFSYYGNLYISSITHSGTNLNVRGKIRFTAKGPSGSSYYDWGVQADPSGSQGFITILGNGVSIANGSNKDVDFSTTISNVSTSTTSISFGVRYVAWYNSSHTSTYWDVTKSWTLSFSPSGSPPADFSATNIVPEWDRVSFTSTIGSPNGTLIYHCPCISKVPLVQYTPKYENQYTAQNTVSTTVSNASLPISNPDWTIKGCGFYYVGAYAENAAGKLYGQGPSTYTPPALPQFSYSDPGGGGSKTYPVTFTGVVANNNTTYDAAELNRTIRYKIDNGNWTYVDNATVATLDSVTSFNVVVPAASTATVEGWMTYHGLQSQVETIVISNTNQAGKIYGSVNGRTKELVKLYGSVNGRTKKLVKVYASVGGVARKVYEDV